MEAVSENVRKLPEKVKIIRNNNGSTVDNLWKGNSQNRDKIYTCYK